MRSGISGTRISKWDKRMYPVAVLSGFVIPMYFAGVGGLLLAGFIGVVFSWHVTWCVNSVCHMFGYTEEQYRRTKDTSKNNRLLAFISWIGEAYHYYHHQKQSSAVLGWRWYHIDLGKWLLYLGEPIGLFWDVSGPPAEVDG